jgi:hypothetical protein
MQPARRYRFALIELYSDLTLQYEFENVADAIQAAVLAAPHLREDAVSRVLDELEKVACERVLFPGWTLVGDELPQWVIDRSTGRTFVIEMLPPTAVGKRATASSVDQRPRVFVVRDRQILVRRVFQLFSSRAQAGEPGHPSQAALNLTHQLTGQAPPDRRWRDPDFPESALILCGEVLIIYATVGGNPIPVVQPFPSFDLIMNPSHTPNKRDAMRRIRRHLSQMRPNAVLLMTANTHSPWRKVGKSQNQGRRAAAAEAYCNGHRIQPSRTIPVGPHRILLFE